MTTSAQTRFTCPVYPEPAKLTDAGLQHAWTLTVNKLQLPADHPTFKCGFAKSDFIEAMAMLILEDTYRWYHLGGMDKFKAICPFPDMVS